MAYRIVVSGLVSAFGVLEDEATVLLQARRSIAQVKSRNNFTVLGQREAEQSDAGFSMDVDQGHTDGIGPSPAPVFPSWHEQSWDCGKNITESCWLNIPCGHVHLRTGAWIDDGIQLHEEYFAGQLKILGHPRHGYSLPFGSVDAQQQLFYEWKTVRDGVWASCCATIVQEAAKRGCAADWWCDTNWWSLRTCSGGVTCNGQPQPDPGQPHTSKGTSTTC